MIDLAIDYGPPLALAAFFITVAYIMKDAGLVEWRSITTPEAPVRERMSLPGDEELNFADALAPKGRVPR